MKGIEHALKSGMFQITDKMTTKEIEMPGKISAKHLKKLVHQLVDEHRRFGLKSVNLAIWYGEKEQTTHIHLFEVIDSLPESLEGKLEPILYPPSKTFPIYLSAIVVAPGDVENAIQRKDPLLTEVVSDQPEILFVNRKGEKLWESMKNVS